MSAEILRPSRRVTLAWFAAAAAGPLAAGCAPTDPSGWREVKSAPINAPGYGTDPDLTSPTAPWPLTLTDAQRAIVRAAADRIVPGEGDAQGAGALGVDAFVDEWISAPYADQQNDRPVILSGLRWLDAEANKRFSKGFAALDAAQQDEIFDDIAFRDRVKQGYGKPAEFFARLRNLVLGGYYTLPEGVAEIGYIGNTPITGAYPGPSAEALAHLREHVEKLGLPWPL